MIVLLTLFVNVFAAAIFFFQLKTFALSMSTEITQLPVIIGSQHLAFLFFHATSLNTNDVTSVTKFMGFKQHKMIIDTFICC